MKSLSIILLTILTFLSTSCNAQIKNPKIETVKIWGNCGMCESTIEKAGNKKKVAKVEWDRDTKMATITYDATKTNQDEILKRIALAGYDNEKYLAPDDVYAGLPGCCQYDRAKETINTGVTPTVINSTPEKKQEVSQLAAVFSNYFALKDALVKTDGNAASAKSSELFAAINAVKMENLTTEEHTIWMKIVGDLKTDVEHIKDTKDAARQRDHFMTLSKNIYQLIKVSKQDTPSYYQFCPMANGGKGANWLSKENIVKNPYYGSKMLSCGKTVETIN